MLSLKMVSHYLCHIQKAQTHMPTPNEPRCHYDVAPARWRMHAYTLLSYFTNYHARVKVLCATYTLKGCSTQ